MWLIWYIRYCFQGRWLPRFGGGIFYLPVPPTSAFPQYLHIRGWKCLIPGVSYTLFPFLVVGPYLFSTVIVFYFCPYTFKAPPEIMMRRCVVPALPSPVCTTSVPVLRYIFVTLWFVVFSILIIASPCRVALTHTLVWKYAGALARLPPATGTSYSYM